MALIMFIIFCMVSAIAGGLIYIFFWMPLRLWLKKRDRLSVQQNRRFNKAFIIIFIAIPVWAGYDAAFPGKGFYADEFKRVTLRDLPDSAVIISSEASYPDFHGDYISQSTIRLSHKDYRALKVALQTDDRISKMGENKYPDDFFDIPEQPVHKDAYILFFRQIPGEAERYLTIEFSRDGKTVYVQVSVS